MLNTNKFKTLRRKKTLRLIQKDPKNKWVYKSQFFNVVDFYMEENNMLSGY